MLTAVLLFAGVLLASAFCSMSEAAILSLPMVRARILYEQGKKNSKHLLYLKENIAHVIASLVIINNAINVVGSIFIGNMITTRFGNRWLGVTSTVLTFSIIIFSEVIPKTIGERHKVRLSTLFAKPLRVVTFIFSPLVDLIIRLTQPFLHGTRTSPKITEEEIKMMLRLGRAEGTVETDEETLCNHVFKLNDVRAAQIMKPIDQIYALPAQKTLEEMKDAILSSRFSRIAVYDKDPLDIVGIVQQSVLLREIAKDNYKALVRDFMAVPMFVHALTRADALLEKFQAYHQHLFIVQDSDGKDIGIVTMEDALEELFGEIYDEKDVARPAAQGQPR